MRVKLYSSLAMSSSDPSSSGSTLSEEARNSEMCMPLPTSGAEQTTQYFTSRHEFDLANILANYSSKWHEIGTALRLPRNLLDTIQGRLFLNPKMQVSTVISEWLSENYDDAEPPTATL